MLVYRADASPYCGFNADFSLRTQALMEIPMTQRDVVFPAGRQALYERNRYSPAIRSNGFLLVSGQVGSREDGSPEPDLEKQVRLAFTNLNPILLAAGCTFDNVVDVTVFIVDPETRFERIWKVIPEFWGEAPHPTLTGVGVTWLYGFDFEIKVIARLPEAVEQ
ncbi:Translation initiation inhibitor [Pseudomonas syringae pv. aptata]|nr:Translation initiation inhibitor [Pseudomonas syringae pv. aptata]